MKVKEALTKVFRVSVGNKYRWGLDTNGVYGRKELDELEVQEQGCGQTHAGDRKLLTSNFESEVELLDNFGCTGLMGFKMRNGQRALFLFNLPGNSMTIDRLRTAKSIELYNHAKRAYKDQTDYSVKNEEFEAWVTLKTIGGQRL